MHSFFDVPIPTVIGHRGAAGRAPENTLASFAAALEDGAAILESDVFLSSDGVPVLLHDPEIDRTTDGRGPAAALSFAEIKAFDGAARFDFSVADAVERTDAIRVPSLEEAFDAFPAARFNLEIKSEDPRAIAATLGLIESRQRSDRTLLAAGEDVIMRPLREAVAKHSATPALGASVSEVVAAVQAATTGGPMPEGVMALQIPASFMGEPLATEPFVVHAHAHGVVVHVWTINEPGEMKRLLDLGVDGIVTDFPGRLTRALKGGAA